MKRVPKAIQDYQKKYYDKTTNEGAIYASDISDVYECSGGKNADLVDLISNALEAGFMIGYRRAKYEYKQQNKNKTA